MPVRGPNPRTGFEAERNGLVVVGGVMFSLSPFPTEPSGLGQNFV